jgi:DNA-binding CsgD family transcriptional regulator
MTERRRHRHSYPLRGREAELELIRGRLLATVEGRSGVVIVEGMAGLGKTSLLDEATTMADDLGVRAGYGRLAAGDQNAPLAGLFEALFDGAPALVDREALRRLHLTPADRYWLLEDLEDLLEQTAIETPLLLCVDDLQWGSAACFAAARVLPQRLRTVPILWVFASRANDAPDDLRTAFIRLEEIGARRMSIGPLNSSAVIEIVSDVVEAEPDADLIELAQRVHGSPFLLVELVNGLLEEGLIKVEDGRAILVEDRLPMRVRDTMRDRLSRMTPLAREAAGIASVLGSRIGFESLVTMLDVPPVRLLGPLDELIRADLIVDDGEHLRFRHDLIRESVRQTLPATVRRTLQRQAVDILLESGSTPADVALQLAESAQPGDEPAAETLFNAAKAIGYSSPEVAADLAQKAVELIGPNHPLRAPMVVEAAVLLHAAGRVIEGKRFAETALRAVLSPEENAAVQFSISGMLSISADLRAEANRRALALPDLSQATRARHLARLFFNLMGAGRPQEALEMLPEAETAAERTGDPDARFSIDLAMTGVLYVQGEFAHHLEKCEAAILIGRETDDVPRRWMAEQYRSESLVVLDRLDEARHVSDEGRAACEQARQAVSRRHWDAWRGRQLYFAGNLPDAAAVLEGAYVSDEGVEVVSALDAAAVMTLGQIALHMADDALTRNAVAIARKMIATGVPEVQRLASWLLALNAMAAARAEEACNVLSKVGPSPLPIYPMDIADPPKLVRIALAASRLDLADHAVSVAEGRAKKNPTLATINGVAAHARGLRDNSLDDLRQAVEILDTGPRPLTRASALEDFGCALIAEQSTDQGIDRLNEVLEQYVQHGATWDARRVRARLGALGIRRRVAIAARPESGWGSLTESELNVVQRVAEGLTNREVARQLFVSPHTVNSHLRHVFTKLGINSRVELARLASESLREPG